MLCNFNFNYKLFNPLNSNILLYACSEFEKFIRYVHKTVIKFRSLITKLVRININGF